MAAMDTTMENLLAAVTDALLVEDESYDDIIAEHNVPRDEVMGLVNVIQLLHRTLVGVPPSPQFKRRLKQELMGSPRRVLISPVRYLPVRVQVAALVTIVAGFLLFFRRRLIGDVAQDIEATALH